MRERTTVLRYSCKQCTCLYYRSYIAMFPLVAVSVSERSAALVASAAGVNLAIYIVFLLFSRELFEVMSTSKSQRTDDIDTSQLLQLLIQKDKDVQEMLKTGLFKEHTDKISTHQCQTVV